MTPVHVVGAGLAGCEAAWQIAAAGVPVVLHEMRPARMTPAHKTGGLAELVCSNSFRSDDGATKAVGLLHAEMRRLGSLIMRPRRTIRAKLECLEITYSANREAAECVAAKEQQERLARQLQKGSS